MGLKKRYPLLTPRKASLVNENTAKSLFKDILNEGIPYGYQQANCHNLSHYITIFLETKGIKCAKIWAFAPIIYSPFSSKLISFPDEKSLSPTGNIDWGYHVAPVLQVKVGNKVRKMVIDPSLFPKGLVRYETWLTKLNTKKLIYLIMDADWYLFNSTPIPNKQLDNFPNNFQDANQPSVVLPEWFSDKLISDFYKYEDDCEYYHWIEKGMAVNETAITFYNDEIKPLLHTNTDNDVILDYKNLVGNVFNFETIFRDYAWNDEMNLEFQEKHESIILKYREIYNDNYIKWEQNLNNHREQIKIKKNKFL